VFIFSGARQRSTIAAIGNLSIREILVVTSAYVRPPVQTLGEGGGESQDNPTGVETSSFLGGKSHGAFGQPAFFLAANRMTTVAFEKEVF